MAVLSGSAFAQDKGTEAFDAYVKGLEELGIEVETGAVDYDSGSDTLTVTDSSLTLAGTIRDESKEDTDVAGKDNTENADTDELPELSYSISTSTGTMTITGFAHDNDVFSAESWVYSDDTEFSISGEMAGIGRLNLDSRLSGVSVTNYNFTMPRLPPENEQRKVSRWLPFVKLSLLTSYDEFKIDTLGSTLEAHTMIDGVDKLFLSGTMQMDGFRIADAVDGRVGEHSLDRIVQNMQSLDPASGQMVTQTTTQGKTVYQDMDFAAMVDLIDPDVPETGEERTFIGSISAIDYSNSQAITQGVALQVDVDKVSAKNITITKRENDILSQLDRLFDRNEPVPAHLFNSVFQLYRSLGVEDARVSGIKMTVPPITSQKETVVSVREISSTNVNSDGIDEMMIVGLDAPDLPNGASIKLDWAALGEIEFAEYAPMREMFNTLMTNPNYGESHPLEVARAFLPRSLGYEVEGLLVNMPDTGLTQIGRAEMSISTTVPPIPTNLYLKNDGIRVPVNAIEDSEAKALLQALGLDVVIWSDETRLYWDEATLELRLERLMLEIEDLGRIEASARFANVPKELFEDPEGQGQTAAIVAQFVDASFVFKDSGLTSKGLAHMAEAQDISEDLFREAMISQAAEATAPIQNEAFTQMVKDAATQFLNDPKELRITIVPENAVPLAQIIGSMAAPQTLPDLLNVKVEAN